MTASKLAATLMTAAVLASTEAGAGTVFTDLTTFNTAAAADHLTISTDDFSTYAQQNIAVGQILGSFKYTFDPSVTLPTIGTDGGVNVLVGGPNSVGFVGGNSTTLTYTGTNKLLAFGATFSYAPSFQDLVPGTYNLTINDGAAANTNVGNPAGLTGNGGSFFLGFIGSVGEDFTAATISSLLQATDGSLVVAYEINQLDFGEGQVPNPNAVPLPGALPLFATGLGAIGLLGWRRKRKAQAVA